MLYYYPCRPLLISPTHPSVIEKSVDPEWDAEVKKNGTRLVLQYTKDGKRKSYGDFIFNNRHNEILAYEPLKEVIEELRQLELPYDTQIDAELLHFKTKQIKHQIYVYDLYVFGGKLMIGPLSERRERLHDIFKDRPFQHLTIAKTYKEDFKALFDKVIVNEEDEGLVMKHKDGKIVWNMKKSPDVPWQQKIRRPQSGGNYKF